MKMDCKFLKDFKAFAMRGNVLDMAVGVIIGGAFGKIVTSLVNNVVMPLLGMLVGGIDFTSLQWVLSPAQVAADGTVVREEVAMQYGLFLQNTFDFIIIAFCIFLFVKLFTRLTQSRKAEVAKPAAPPEPSAEAKLLAEIRDLLRERKQ